MLQTPLESITSLSQHQELIKNNEKVVVVCGRMGPMCVPVYGIMDALKEKHTDVKFYDFEFDHPDAAVIRNLPECKFFRGLPFTIYYRNGKVVKATSSIQEARDVKGVIKEVF
ncbi:MAG: thioredoxin [Promethearchaeota archaeon]